MQAVKCFDDELGQKKCTCLLMGRELKMPLNYSCLSVLFLLSLNEDSKSQYGRTLDFSIQPLV